VILDKAAGNPQANYDGHGRFWNLPLPQFLEVVIYGMRMIAPPTLRDICDDLARSVTQFSASSCCHEAKPLCPTPAPKKKPLYPGRGAKSGLVIGLRGQRPLDGTHFPQLQWGGTPVMPQDIQFISDCIDDGCPEADTLLALALAKAILSAGPAFAGSTFYGRSTTNQPSGLPLDICHSDREGCF